MLREWNLEERNKELASIKEKAIEFIGFAHFGKSSYKDYSLDVVMNDEKKEVSIAWTKGSYIKLKYTDILHLSELIKGISNE
jgi:hypothetical protein